MRTKLPEAAAGGGLSPGELPARCCGARRGDSANCFPPSVYDCRVASGRRARTTGPVAVVLLLLLGLPGCSYTIRGPSTREPTTEAPQCDRSATGRRALDTVAAMGTGMPAIFLLSSRVDCSSQLFCYDKVPLWVGLSFAAAYVVMLHAVHTGTQRIKACRDAHRRWDELQQASPTAGP